MKKSSGTIFKNPFKVLVGNLSTDWQEVSISYLKEVHDIINSKKSIIKTYGDAFDILQYLHNVNVVELVPVDTHDGIYKIRKVDHSGKIS
jgi:hypothetical protein